MTEAAAVGRALSPLPPIEDASVRSVERKQAKDTTTIAEPNLETEVSILFEVEIRMNRLHLCQNHSCQACLNDFIYIASKIEKYYDSVTTKLLEIGFLETFQQILRRYFEEAVTEADGKSFNACMFATLITCSTVIIMTDVSSEACRKVIQLEIHIDIINSLKNGHLDPRQKNQNLSPTLCELVDQLLSVLYNIVQLTPEVRELYLKHGIIEVIQRFRTGTSNSLSCFALMFSAWMISDKSSFNLNANDEDFRFLNQQLRSSLDTDTHRSDYGYKAVEILSAINMLVVNDANKERIIKSGVLSSYVAFLEPHFDTEEQFLATQGLWSIAFKCAEEIKKEKFCVESKQ